MNYTICFSLDFSEFQSSKSLNSCCHFADNCYKMHFVLPCVDFSFCLSKPNKMLITFFLLSVSAILPSPVCKLTTFTKGKKKNLPSVHLFKTTEKLIVKI